MNTCDYCGAECRGDFCEQCEATGEVRPSWSHLLPDMQDRQEIEAERGPIKE